LTLAEAVERAQRLLAAPPGPGRHYRRPRPHLGGLTRREYEVALQVALGKTNREIAADLSIGEKTVEMHVSNSLNKLGLRSRAQLAAWIASSTTSEPFGASAEH
ncbi:LuxR C-terminal-related transcriptional regulator, partial [Sphaerobacter sp.]|uniref:response regulator transcription factor n=1 Tax=Sphaerobacter sp. TaxID=2099654 RepID=UPI001DB451F7